MTTTTTTMKTTSYVVWLIGSIIGGLALLLIWPGYFMFSSLPHAAEVANIGLGLILASMLGVALHPLFAWLSRGDSAHPDIWTTPWWIFTFLGVYGVAHLLSGAWLFHWSWLVFITLFGFFRPEQKIGQWLQDLAMYIWTNRWLAQIVILLTIMIILFMGYLVVAWIITMIMWARTLYCE